MFRWCLNPGIATIFLCLVQRESIFRGLNSAFLPPSLDEEGVRYVPVRPRPPITLLRHYRNPWKAAYHHFQRYSDVRVKGLPSFHHKKQFVKP